MLREIKFLCLERSAEDFADMMMDAGAMSVSIEDADLGSPDEKPLYGEPGTEPDTFAWNRSIVSVLADVRSTPLRPPPSPLKRSASKHRS